MTKSHLIKVFHPNSKRADFTVKAVTPKQGAASIAKELGQEDADKVMTLFRTLKRLGVEQVSYHNKEGRKIKVEVPLAA